MKRIFWIFPAFLFLACKSNNIPDVSSVNVQLSVKRFDKDFFAIDTNQVVVGLDKLEKTYPAFLKDYLYNILALTPPVDSAALHVKSFIKDYRPVFDTAQRVFSDLTKTTEDIKKGFQFVKYYFPDYRLPTQVITFIGPLEGYANVLTSEGIAVGLQLYLGSQYSVYQSDYISQVYPAYQSRRFEPAYIPVNCLKNIIDDLYPGAGPDQPLIYQMIEEGKKLYLLDHFLPYTADSLKTGYTAWQLKGCYENEGMIWNYFLQSHLLYASDPALTREYMNDGPKTEALGEASPGFIGQFVGWQIVKKYMQLFPDKKLPDLLATSAKDIFEVSKYKPR